LLRNNKESNNNPMNRLLSIRRDLGLQLLSLYLMLIVPFIIALLVFDQFVGERIRLDVQANDLSLARAIAQETDLSIQNSLQAVQELAVYPSVIASDPDGMRELFSVILNTRPDVNLVYRLDANGIMLYHYPEGPGTTVGIDFSFRDYYQRARQTKEPLVSEGRISPTTNQPVATAVMPLWSQDNRFIGLVATNIKLESLSQTLSEIIASHRSEEGFQVVIMDSSSHVIAYPDPSLLLHESGEILPDFSLSALTGTASSKIANDPTNEQRLFTYAPIPSAGWTVIVSRPTSAAFATQITIHRVTLVTSTIFLLIGLVFWIALSRRVIAPIERLAPISQAIGLNQEISLDERKQLTGMSNRPDQIGRLIRSILRMEQSIAARMKEQAILLETSTAVVSTLDPQTVLDRILEQVEKLLDVKMCVIIALDEQHGYFRARASRGLSKRYTEQLAIQPSEPLSVTMRALRTKEPIQVSDTEMDASFSAMRPRARSEGYRSVLAVPLNTQHAPPSALLVYRPEPHVFTDTEIQLVVSFANHATMAIENAALFARSDMRLQEQTRRLEALVQSLHDGLILGDLNGDIVYANRRISDLADLPAEDITGTPINRVLSRIITRTNEPEVVRKEVNDALKGKFPRIAEIPINISGRMAFLRMQVFDVTDSQGVSIGHGLILRDVTTDRELDRMKSSLVATVSHELRTPLASIKGYATTLLAEDVEWDRDSQHEFLAIISEESDRLTNLVNNLLDLSRIEAGSLRLSRVECPIEETIDRVAKRTPLGSENRLEIEIASELPPLFADPPRLETILRNLIENAAKYAGEEAQIRIQVNRNMDAIIFRVIDNGPGIPIEESQNVFESFYRLDDSLSRVTSGAGLGLAICQGLVRAHGGDIWVEPRENGACIAFSIPIIENHLVEFERKAQS
jgi:PAS domain S-box-containing protein